MNQKNWSVTTIRSDTDEVAVYLKETEKAAKIFLSGYLSEINHLYAGTLDSATEVSGEGTSGSVVFYEPNSPVRKFTVRCYVGRVCH